MLIGIIPAAVYAAEGDPKVVLTVTPDKTTAVAGEEITFTVTMQSEYALPSMAFRTAFPEGLEYVDGSGAIDADAKAALGCDDIAWTEWTKRNNGAVEDDNYVNGIASVPVAPVDGVVVCSFKATFAADAALGEYTMDLIGLDEFCDEEWNMFPESEISVVYSINQLKMAMFKKGYYNATVTPIVERNRKKKKAQVLYSLNIGKPYYIREIEYVIDIPQYRRIVLGDTANALVKVGNRYDEELLSEERERIIANIRNQGYFYVSTSIITIEVDSNNSHKVLTVDGNPTVSVSILLNFNEISDPEIKKKFEYKYHFNKVFVYTNYDVSFERDIAIDSTQFFSVRDKNDPTIYTFLSPYTERRFNKNRKIIKDFKYRVIATAGPGRTMAKSPSSPAILINSEMSRLSEKSNSSIFFSCMFHAQ